MCFYYLAKFGLMSCFFNNIHTLLIVKITIREDMINNFKNYLKNNILNTHDGFRNFDQLDDDIGEGTSKKTFQLCSGRLLLRMYDDILGNPSCSYVTCVDQLIRTSSREEFEKALVSVVVKEDRGTSLTKHKFITSELICSRLANLFGIKTEYTLPVSDDPNKVILVDFLQNVPTGENSNEFRSQKMETFNELTNTEVVSARSEISMWLQILEDVLNNNERFSGVSTERKNQIIVDFITQFIGVSLILSNTDFNGWNVAFVHSDDTDWALAPAYDYEYCLGNSSYLIDKYIQKPANFMQTNIEILAKDYPNQMVEAMQHFKLTEDKKLEIQAIFNEFSKPKDYVNQWGQIIIQNLNKANEIYDNAVLKNNDKTM